MIWIEGNIMKNKKYNPADNLPHFKGEKHPYWRKTPNKEWFYREYVTKNRSPYKIADELKISPHTIYERLKKYNIPRGGHKRRLGSNHAQWKGGRRLSGGYVKIYSPQHPNCTTHKTVLEHRLVMEKQLGRYLKQSEVVHHLNGIKHDNRPENLVVLSDRKHGGKTYEYIYRLQERIRSLENKTI